MGYASGMNVARPSLSRQAGALLVILMLAAAAMTCSCSRAVRMSLVEPTALAAAPAGTNSKAPERFTRADTVATQDAGVLVLTGDSIRVYERVEHNPGIVHANAPWVYQFKRDAKELRVLGYQPAQGTWQAWEGLVGVRAGALEFRRKAQHLHPLRNSAPAETLRMDPALVTRIDLDQTDPVYTTVVILGVSAVIAGIAVLGMMAGTSGTSW